ncbi:MAG: HNH endonuclease [Patescibacteria group bacterium]|nr:HNH endonuclease [Patescibacteria group bacterium]
MRALRDYISYNPITGEFRWLVSNNNRVKKGDLAGTLTPCGYIAIQVLGKRYQAHRLGWFLQRGSWPSRNLDHINENKTDNRLVNLRLATHRQNGCNRGSNKNNKSGYKGVCWHKATCRWLAQICVGRVQIHLGLFDSPEEAYSAYCVAAGRYHGEFSNTGSREDTRSCPG